MNECIWTRYSIYLTARTGTRTIAKKVNSCTHVTFNPNPSPTKQYWLTSLLFGPSPLSPLNTLGLLLCLLGQSLRSAALYTCADNFNHIIQDTKNNANPKQRLVREGVYGVLRHPSYTGWFYWSIGTQVRFNFQFNLQSSNVLVRANLFLT